MSATLQSNSGEEQFVIELGTPAEYAHDSGFEASVHLRGRHWDGDHTFPFSTSIHGLWLGAVDLKSLQEHISRWLCQPLDCLTAESLRAEFRLTRLPGQGVQVRFGSRPDPTSTPNPVVTIALSAGALQIEFHCVTDQSCLAVFARELSAELAPSRENAV